MINQIAEHCKFHQINTVTVNTVFVSDAWGTFSVIIPLFLQQNKYCC